MRDEANQTDNEIHKNDAREISNLEQVSVRKEQKDEANEMNHKQ